MVLALYLAAVALCIASASTDDGSVATYLIVASAACVGALSVAARRVED